MKSSIFQKFEKQMTESLVKLFFILNISSTHWPVPSKSSYPRKSPLCPCACVNELSYYCEFHHIPFSDLCLKLPQGLSLVSLIFLHNNFIIYFFPQSRSLGFCSKNPVLSRKNKYHTPYLHQWPHDMYILLRAVRWCLEWSRSRYLNSVTDRAECRLVNTVKEVS